jgi:hypothetical protein
MSASCVDETFRHPPCQDYITQWHIKDKVGLCRLLLSNPS